MGFIDGHPQHHADAAQAAPNPAFFATFALAHPQARARLYEKPQQVEVAAQNTANANVEQHVIAVDTARKRSLLERLIVDLNMNQVIVFCKTKQSVDQVNRDLQRRDIAAQAIHGDKSQQTRPRNPGGVLKKGGCACWWLPMWPRAARYCRITVL